MKNKYYFYYYTRLDVLRTAPAAPTVPPGAAANFQQQVAALRQQMTALQQQRTQQQQQQPQHQYMPNLLNMMGLPPQVENTLLKRVFTCFKMLLGRQVHV